MKRPAPLLSSFPLSPGERQNPVVHRLAEHCQAKLDQLRRQNDDPELDLFETQWLRGQIKTYADLLKVLTDERPSVN